MLKKRILQAILLLVLFPALTNAQITTSSLGGFVKTSTTKPLVGATITITHEPTGTIYRIQSRVGGRFDISNLNPGGPYTVEASFINFANEKRTDIYLSLG
ncbi:carboxypeptidase regulatory-like domain-containing protein, partial|nr:carboxypeptidase regulatory-like domain-containing protein [Escherichia coli]